MMVDAPFAGLYHTRVVRLRLSIALLGLVGCLPEPTTPPFRFDAGAPINFDVPAVDVPPVDVPPVDRPVIADTGHDAGVDVRRPSGDGPDPARLYPGPPYGTTPPAVMQPFQLADCARGNYRFDGSEWITARATVVEFTTGYCVGCLEAAQLLEGNVARPYAMMGLRTITVLIDGENPGEPPTAEFCSRWTSMGGIRHAMALDVGGMLRAHTPPGLPLPQWVLTDENGRILWRGGGSMRTLPMLIAEVQNVLGLAP